MNEDAIKYWTNHLAQNEASIAAEESELVACRGLSVDAVRRRMREAGERTYNPSAGKEGGKAGYLRGLRARIEYHRERIELSREMIARHSLPNA